MGSNFHARIMNIQPSQNFAVDRYSCGHKEARHAAAEIALEADAMIEKLALNESAFVDLEIRTGSAEQSLKQMDEAFEAIKKSLVICIDAHDSGRYEQQHAAYEHAKNTLEDLGFPQPSENSDV